MKAPNRFIWRQTAPGRYEREIDEIEQFYTTMAKVWEKTGHSYFAITACSGLSVDYPDVINHSHFESRVESALRWAWRRIRYEHPTLAAPVSYDAATQKCRKEYRAFKGEGDIEEWEKETFIPIVKPQTGLQFANTDPKVGRFATLYLVVPPPSKHPRKEMIMQRDLVFRAHHDQIDGIGTLKLFDNLFRHAARALASDVDLPIPFGDEHRKLSPPFRIAAGIPTQPNPEQLAKFQSIQTANAKASQEAGVEILSFPLSSTANFPAKSQRVGVHFSRAQTTAVVARCKAFGVTPTIVLHTAMALALRDLREKTIDERVGRYIGYSLVNLRRSCMPPYHSPSHVASVYHSISDCKLVVDLAIPTESSANTHQCPLEFNSTLAQVNDFYRGVKIDVDYLSTVPLLFTKATPPYPSPSLDDSAPAQIPERNPNPSVSLSSMGIIDKFVQTEHGLFKVEEPWVMGAEYSTGIGLFLGTWKGKMGLSAGYNEAFYAEDEIVFFLELVNKIVLEGLEIDN